MADDQATVDKPYGRPAGNQYVSRGWIVLIGGVLLVITVSLLAGLYKQWPSCKPSNDRPTTTSPSQNPEENVEATSSRESATATSETAADVTINSISPNSGPTEGNTEVTIYGKGFKNGAKVRFGGVPGTVLNLAEESITARTPAYLQEEGEVDVIVTNADGKSSALNSGSKYTYACPAPSGTRLLLLVILAGALGGMLHSLRSFYWYVGNRKFVWSWVPMYITLPFIGASIAVIFYLIIGGGLDEQMQRKDASFIIAISALVGLFSQQALLKLKEVADVVLTKPGEGKDSKPQESGSGTDDGATPITVPTITGIEANEGSTSGGDKVTITGSGFSIGATVSFGDEPALEAKVISGTEIIAKTPPHPEGIVDVVVTNPDKQSVSFPQGYTYREGPPVDLDQPAPKPKIEPESGATDGGDEVKITGTGFSSVKAVDFGGVSVSAADIAFDNATSTITVLTPRHEEGEVEVTVTNKEGESIKTDNKFVYVPEEDAEEGEDI